MDGTAVDFERWRARGDVEALTRVFDAQSPGLLRFAVHLVGDANAAEDLVQETFLTALRSASEYDAGRPIDRWLAGILVHRAQQLRREARRFTSQSLPERWDLDTPLEAASRREMSVELARAVDALEEPYRAAILMNLHGLEPAVIAHVLGRSPGVVRVQLFRAREMLRKSLPAGIASALVMLSEPARGLDAVRHAVIQEAGRLAPAASVTGGLLGGVLVMKKLVAALVILLVVLAAYMAGRERDAIHAEREPVADVPLMFVSSTGEIATAEPLDPSPSDERTAEALPIEKANTKEVLRGIVLDANTDKPIAGARIALYAPLTMTAREIRTRYWDQLQTTDQGMRQFRPWPYYDVQKSPPYYVPEFTPEECLDLEPVRVRVPPDAGVAPYVEATSGPDGRFDLSAESTDAFLTCDANGYAQRAFATRADRLGFDPEADRTIYMSTNRTLRGRIVDASGQQLHESIRLSLYGHSPKRLWWPDQPRIDPQDRRLLFRTDAEGRFEVETDAAFGFVSSADARWRLTQHGHLQADGVTVKETPWFDFIDETGDVRLVLEPVCSMLVRDAETRQPIEDAYVTLHTSSTRRPLREGWFHLEGGRLAVATSWIYATHAPEEVDKLRVETTLRVWKPGYAAAIVKIADMFAAGVHEVDLVRDASAPVAGRIHRGSRGVEGVKLFAYLDLATWSQRAASQLPSAGAVSGDDGTFFLSLPTGRYVLVVEYGQEKIRRALDVPCVDGIDLDLDAMASVNVRMTQADGQPKTARSVRMRDALGMETRAITDSDGVARIENLATGLHEVSVSHRAGKDNFRAGETRSVELTAGTNDIAFVVPGAQPMHARLIVEDGPIAGWTARPDYAEGTPLPVAPDGRVPVDFSESRRFAVISPTGVRHAITMPKDAVDGAEVRLQGGGRGYRGRVVDSQSCEPMSDLELWFTSESGGMRRTSMVATDENGRFDIRGLPENARWARSVGAGRNRTSTFGEVTFEFVNVPADPPIEVILRRPRFLGTEYEGYPTAALEGRFSLDAPLVAGLQADVSVIQRGDVYSTWMSRTFVVGADGIVSGRVGASGERQISLTGGEPYRTLMEERWTPSGADPEVREFKLPR